MGHRGRKRRLKHFRQRAEAFAKRFEKGKGFEEIVRHGIRLPVGKGQHRRLVRKRHPESVEEPQRIQKAIEERLVKKVVRQRHYSFVQIEGRIVRGHPIQEYFHRPSLAALKAFLLRKSGKSRVPPEVSLSKEDLLLCRKLLKEFPKITLQKVEDAEMELIEHATKAGELVSSDNVIVFGTRGKKLKVGIVGSDVEG